MSFCVSRQGGRWSQAEAGLVGRVQSQRQAHGQRQSNPIAGTTGQRLRTREALTLVRNRPESSLHLETTRHQQTAPPTAVVSCFYIPTFEQFLTLGRRQMHLLIYQAHHTPTLLHYVCAGYSYLPTGLLGFVALIFHSADCRLEPLWRVTVQSEGIAS